MTMPNTFFVQVRIGDQIVLLNAKTGYYLHISNLMNYTGHYEANAARDMTSWVVRPYDTSHKKEDRVDNFVRVSLALLLLLMTLL